MGNSWGPTLGNTWRNSLGNTRGSLGNTRGSSLGSSLGNIGGLKMEAEVQDREEVPLLRLQQGLHTLQDLHSQVANRELSKSC